MCKWIVRPGTNNTFWAYTRCEPGFNYLSKVSKAENIRQEYGGRICPICGERIEINMELLSEELEIEQ